jgi:hypothetical protein
MLGHHCGVCSERFAAFIGKLIIVLGLTTILSFAFNAICSVYSCFLRGGKNLKKKYGQWGKADLSSFPIVTNSVFSFSVLSHVCCSCCNWRY